LSSARTPSIDRAWQTNPVSKAYTFGIATISRPGLVAKGRSTCTTPVAVNTSR
jgi:hypothetical protein